MANIRKAGPGFPNRKIRRPNGPKNGVPLADSIQIQERYEIIFAVLTVSGPSYDKNSAVTSLKFVSLNFAHRL